MKKIVFFFGAVLLCAPAAQAAQTSNPFMGYADHQVGVYMAQGVDSGFLVPPPTRLVPFYMLQIQYSQPTTFFKIPARQSLNFGETIGLGSKYHWDWDKYSIPMLFASEDLALMHGDCWYFSVGAGVGFQAQQNDRIGSKLLFQFKVAGGWRLTDTWAMEIYTQHFSNGNTAPENNSYGFYGVGMTYSF